VSSLKILWWTWQRPGFGCALPVSEMPNLRGSKSPIVIEPECPSQIFVIVRSIEIGVALLDRDVI
jgi:hypothetical protein